MANSATNFKGARAENYAAVVLNTDHFAETVVHIPRGVNGNAVDVTAVVHMQDEGAESPSVMDTFGRSIMRTCHLYLSTDVSVECRDQEHNIDLFDIRGERWKTVRILRRTPYRQVVLLKRTEGISTTHTRT